MWCTPRHSRLREQTASGLAILLENKLLRFFSQCSGSRVRFRRGGPMRNVGESQICCGAAACRLWAAPAVAGVLLGCAHKVSVLEGISFEDCRPSRPIPPRRSRYRPCSASTLRKGLIEPSVKQIKAPLPWASARSTSHGWLGQRRAVPGMLSNTNVVQYACVVAVYAKTSLPWATFWVSFYASGAGPGTVL